MESFLAVALAMPTVIYTVLLGATVVYWLFVILGALELPGADSAGEKAGEIAGEKLAQAIGEKAGEAAGEKVAEAIGEKAGEAIGEKAGEAAISTFISALRLRQAPVTVTFTLIVLFSWFMTFMGSRWVMRSGMEGALHTLALVAVPLVAFVLSLPLTSLAIRPLAPLFTDRVTRGQETLIGKSCIVQTGRVDARFGQALLDDGAAGLLLSVRCEREANGLKKGDEALIVGYDRATHTFKVEPLATIEQEALASAARSEQRADSQQARVRAAEQKQ